MSCGKPVVCFFKYDSAYPERAPVLNVRTAHQIVDAIEQLVESPGLRKDIGLKSREWIEKYHGHKAVAQKLISHYREME